MSYNVSNPIIVVQGGQFGSEAKGAIAAYLCITRLVNYAVRTGAINAGHTVMYNGKPYAMQQLPTGWINSDTTLVIGPGAYIHPETLVREVKMVSKATGTDVLDRLFIDYRCGIHDERAEAASKVANRHHRMGATGKGCSEAIVAKIRDRNDGYKLFKDTTFGEEYRYNGGKFADTVKLLNRAVDGGAVVLIEGTQGTMLDLHIGPYPYTTSRMTSAANWIAEAGLSPSLNYEVVLVCRTYPIRVAGNSGPMVDEIEWVDLAREINYKREMVGMPPLVDDKVIDRFEVSVAKAAVPTDNYAVPPLTNSLPRLSQWSDDERDKYRVAASEIHKKALEMTTPSDLAELRKLFEMTTVTKKLRRIARLDGGALQYAVTINRPTWVAMTFTDYEFPELAGVDMHKMFEIIKNPDHQLYSTAKRMLTYTRTIHDQLGVPVRTVSFGPQTGDTFSMAHLWSRG